MSGIPESQTYEDVQNVSPIILTEKRCTKCGLKKELIAFPRNKSRKDGLDGWCKACHLENAKQWALKNKDRRREYLEKYNIENAQHIKEKTKQWRIENKEHRNKTERRWRKENPEKAKEQYQKRYARDSKRMRERTLLWQKQNPQKHRGIKRNWQNAYYATTRGYIDVRMSTGIREAINGKKGRRKWESLVDYTMENLIAHLESQFRDGMSWENKGKWHIDHVRPKASFSYEYPSDQQFKECWALENLQPLWAEDNWRKGATWEP